MYLIFTVIRKRKIISSLQEMEVKHEKIVVSHNVFLKTECFNWLSVKNWD